MEYTINKIVYNHRYMINLLIVYVIAIQIIYLVPFQNVQNGICNQQNC